MTLVYHKTGLVVSQSMLLLENIKNFIHNTIDLIHVCLTLQEAYTPNIFMICCTSFQPGDLVDLA